jgi:hypothetical protein
MKVFALYLLALTAFVAPIALPRAAYAQDDATTKNARLRFQEGVDAYDKGQFDQARAAFLQAYALKPHPAVLLNLALSCEKSNHALEASKYFQQYMRDSASIPADKRAEAEKGLAEVRAKLGRLEIQAPAGADIFIDKERVGTAPLADAVDVEPGAHSVLAKTAEGPVETRASAAAGQRVKVAVGVTQAKEPPKVEKPVEPTPPNQPAPPPPIPEPMAGTTEPSPVPVASDKPGILSRPANMTPVYIGLGVGGLGLISTVVFAVAKSSAQDSVVKVESQLRNAGARDGTCNAAPEPRFANGCKTLRDNISAVDTDATIANISAVVMVVGFVGAGAWYLFAPKKPKEAARLTPMLLPPTRNGDGIGGGLTFSTSY